MGKFEGVLPTHVDVTHSRGAGTWVQQLVQYPSCLPCPQLLHFHYTLGEVSVFTQCVQSSVAFNTINTAHRVSQTLTGTFLLACSWLGTGDLAPLDLIGG